MSRANGFCYLIDIDGACERNLTDQTIRFRIGQRDGPRSTPWVVVLKSDKSDVYLLTRITGKAFSVSIHETGRCHIHAPPNYIPASADTDPHFADVWHINPASPFEYPFGFVIPTSELRTGPWRKIPDKRTIWISPMGAESVSIGVFLTRTPSPPYHEMKNAGWQETIVGKRLPDGRDLWVLSARVSLNEEQRTQLSDLRLRLHSVATTSANSYIAPRGLFKAQDNNGTRRYIDVAGASDPA